MQNNNWLSESKIDRRKLLALGLALGASPMVGSLTFAADVDPWEKEIAAFEAKDKVLFPTKEQFLFVGSSTIRLWDLKESFPGLPVINRGFGGSELADSVRFAPRIVIPYQPQAIVLYAGDNDIANGKTPAKIHADYLEFAKVVHEALPKTRLIFLSVKPSPSREKFLAAQRETNNLIKDECAKADWMAFIDTHAALLTADGKFQPELYVKDQLHLSPAGYAKISGLVQRELLKSK